MQQLSCCISFLCVEHRIFLIKQDGEPYLQAMLVVMVIFRISFVDARVRVWLSSEEGCCWVWWSGLKQGSSKLQARKPSRKE